MINASRAVSSIRMTLPNLKAGNAPVLTQTWTVRELTRRRAATSLVVSMAAVR